MSRVTYTQTTCAHCSTIQLVDKSILYTGWTCKQCGMEQRKELSNSQAFSIGDPGKVAPEFRNFLDKIHNHPKANNSGRIF